MTTWCWTSTAGPGELRCENDPAIVPGATHLFEEPGTLEAAARLARDWFISLLAHGLAR
jgi:putative phosphoribosyl transferase